MKTNPSNSSERESIANTLLAPLLNELQYVKVTGESVATARRNRLLHKGCPYVKLGSRVLYRPTDVQSYIERNLRNTLDGPVVGRRPNSGIESHPMGGGEAR